MYYSLLSLKMISFVLFPQASQPSMNFNISELVYYGRALMRPDCISPTLRLYRFLFRHKINQNVWQQIDFQVFICFNCSGATVGSEQQHNQDLREIYKVRRILEFITFYHNALHLTTLFTTMHCI